MKQTRNPLIFHAKIVDTGMQSWTPRSLTHRMQRLLSFQKQGENKK